ncbi:MAG: RnfABCDGE type electron transport complex subunit B [Spirochaetales bacterium]|nr:RnfABCDGE type electron transport complex subunit B [Spirochaetales bacterium]
MAMFADLLLAVFYMAALGAFLSALIAVAVRKLYVYEDPRIDKVEQMLPAVNCGACGYPGCRAFAEAVVKGEAPPSKCRVNSPEANQRIADYLGVLVGEEEKVVARLACQGGSHVARMRARYRGLDSCAAAFAAGGGGKACPWGCLGLGDCERACIFDAIHLNEVGLPVIDEDKCTGCGDCVKACPLELFSLQPVSRKLWVACKNRQKGEEALAECEVACDGCQRCVLNAPEGLIRVRDNLAEIDYSKNHLATRELIDSCPTGALVWIEDGKITKGSAAKRIIRSTPLPIEPG